MGATDIPAEPETPDDRRGAMTIFGGRVAGTGRLEAFSDGVFAIAITLLVLGLSIPSNLDDDRLWSVIAQQGPQFLSAALSFAVIGLYWGSHHTTVRYLSHGDGPLLVVNLAHLATIVFLPFPTLVLAEYSGSFTAVALYAATLTATGLTSAALWWVAWRRRLTVDAVDRDLALARLAGLLATPVVFAASILVALASPTIAMYTWVMAAVDQPITAGLRWLFGKATRT